MMHGEYKCLWVIRIITKHQEQGNQLRQAIVVVMIVIEHIIKNYLT